MNQTLQRAITAAILIALGALIIYILGINALFVLISFGLTLELVYLYAKKTIPLLILISGTIYAFFPTLAIIFNHLSVLFFLPIPIIIDSAGYFVGRAIGGKKLCPNISPNKTRVGASAGLMSTYIYLFALLKFCYPETLLMSSYISEIILILGLAISVAFYFRTWLSIILIPISMIFIIGMTLQSNVINPKWGTILWSFLPVITFIITIVSIAGDLLISKVKRVYGIKDTSNILPGHGGLWDRFDSQIALLTFITMLSFFIII